MLFFRLMFSIDSGYHVFLFHMLPWSGYVIKLCHFPKIVRVPGHCLSIYISIERILLIKLLKIGEVVIIKYDIRC